MRLFETIPKKTETILEEERNQRLRFRRPCTRCGLIHKTTKYGLVCNNCKGRTAEKQFAKIKRKN